MDVTAIPVVDKQQLAKRVGVDLVKHHGKKQHYSVAEIKSSARRLNFPDTWDCWALSMYCSPGDFDQYHRTIGEICDFSSMHHMMIDAVSQDSALPEILHHVTQAIEPSWFSDLLDVFDSDHLDFHS